MADADHQVAIPVQLVQTTNWKRSPSSLSATALLTRIGTRPVSVAVVMAISLQRDPGISSILAAGACVTNQRGSGHRTAANRRRAAFTRRGIISPPREPLRAVIGAYRVKPTRWQTTRIGTIMNSKDRCPECRGGGLVPAIGCSCGGNTHTCTPALCTVCGGAGRIDRTGNGQDQGARAWRSRHQAGVVG